MARFKLGLEPIVYGDRAAKDLAGFLKDSQQIGYVGVEGTMAYRRTPLEKVKELLQEHHQDCPCMHTHYGEFLDEAVLQTNIEFLKGVGGTFLICSGVAKGEGIEQFTEAANTFNRVGELCRRNGLMFCYHNHSSEFRVYDGKVGIHTLYAETDPKLVFACPDVYWVYRGGESPAEFITRYRERCMFLHFKDGTSREFTELGKGEVDLAGAAKAAESTPAEWIVYEQDETKLTPHESSKISFEYLKSIGL